MNKLTEQQASPVFGLRYLEDREVEGLDVVGCLTCNRDGTTATGCDDADQIVVAAACRRACAGGARPPPRARRTWRQPAGMRVPFRSRQFLRRR